MDVGRFAYQVFLVCGEPRTLLTDSARYLTPEDAARAIRPIVGPHTGVLSLQNGVVKDDILRESRAERLRIQREAEESRELPVGSTQ